MRPTTDSSYPDEKEGSSADNKDVNRFFPLPSNNVPPAASAPVSRSTWLNALKKVLPLSKNR